MKDVSYLVRRKFRTKGVYEVLALDPWFPIDVKQWDKPQIIKCCKKWHTFKTVDMSRDEVAKLDGMATYLVNLVGVTCISMDGRPVCALPKE